MYLHRRGSHWWIRKAVPVDLVEILGFAVVRRSLRTKDPALARRRALQLLIRVDDVYAVLRSKRPLRPTRDIALALLDDALRNIRGTDWSFDKKREWITEAQTAISSFTCAPEFGSEDDKSDQPCTDDRIMVSSVDAFGLLNRVGWEAGSTNEAAVALLLAVRQMTSASAETVAAGGRNVAQSVDILAPKPIDHSMALRTVLAQLTELRAMVSSTESNIADLKSSLHTNSAPADKSAVSEAITEERRTRWSDEMLSAAIKRYEVEVLATSGNGLKHDEDVKKRLLVFLTFVTDKPIRDVTRGDIKSYRDHLEKLPDRSESRFKTFDIRVAIELNAKRKEPHRTIGPGTLDLKYLGPVRRFFDWLGDDKQIEKHLCDGIHSHRKSKNGSSCALNRPAFRIRQNSVSDFITF